MAATSSATTQARTAPADRAAAPAIDERDADQIAVGAYHSFYPLVIIDLPQNTNTWQKKSTPG
jgi:hypothetical protein